MASVFPFLLKTKHKTLHVKRAWAKLEILQKDNLHDLRSIECNFQSINLTDLHNKSCSKLDFNFTNKYTLSSLILDSIF